MVQRGLQRFWSNNVLDKPYLEAAITWRFLLLFQWIRSCLFSRCSPSYLLPSAHERKSSPRARKRKRGSKWGKFTEKADTGAWQSIRVCIRRNNPSWNRRHGRFSSHVCTGAATKGRVLSDAGQPRSQAVFLWKMPWRYKICIAKCLYSFRDDFPENLGKTTTQDCKKSTSGWRGSLQNAFAQAP